VGIDWKRLEDRPPVTRVQSPECQKEVMLTSEILTIHGILVDWTRGGYARVRSKEKIMRAHRIAIAVMLIVSVSPTTRAIAQKPTVQNSAEAVEARTLLKLEDDWCKGLVSRDTMMFRRLLAAGFIYTENAKMMTGEEVIKGVLSGDKVERAVNQYMQVHEFGPVAVVTGVLAVTSRGKTGPYTTRYRFTDTWLSKGATWQIVAAQDYIIPDRKGQ
jgi:hypothetical protein